MRQDKWEIKINMIAAGMKDNTNSEHLLKAYSLSFIHRVYYPQIIHKLI